MSGSYYLPSKITIYLRRIASEYQTTGDDLRARLVRGARIFVREAADYDNWNNGMDGHQVVLFLTPEIFGEVTLARKAEFETDILDKLTTCARRLEREYFSRVYFEDEDENDPEFQNAISISARPQINPDLLPIWKPGQIRLFISHRDGYKALAKELAGALEEYGISSFVAHDTIQPMTTWQHEIVKGLETMEIMLAFITDDFHESVWTNQEVGFALGRNIPIVSLKLQKKDPAGFIGIQQALKGKPDDVTNSVPDLYKLLAEKLGHKDRLQTGLVTAFVGASSFTDAKDRFERMRAVVTKLTDEELASVVDGFKNNDQLYKCGHLTSHYGRLTKFIKTTTGKDCSIQGTKIVFAKTVDDDIAF